MNPEIKELITELRATLSDCYLDAGDGGNNNMDVDDACETLDRLEKAIQDNQILPASG